MTKWQILEDVIKAQRNAVEAGAQPEALINFVFEDTVVSDPFMDETGRFPVDPIKHYGEAFLNSTFGQIVK